MLEMYAFYSLLVYIFYTVFKRQEDEDSCGASADLCHHTMSLLLHLTESGVCVCACAIM